MQEWNPLSFIKILESDRVTGLAPEGTFVESSAEDAYHFHKGIPAYEPTPLVSLKGFAKKLGVKAIYVKDESRRFGLKAFKGLGGTYAMYRVICRELGIDPSGSCLEELRAEDYRKQIENMVFVTATDGNHGKGVSWAAGLFGCTAHVLMPFGSSEARAQAIRNAGPAQVTITSMNYDQTVNYAKETSEQNGWFLIQDTAWDGYETIPSWIIQGYLTMVKEALEQMNHEGDEIPTHVFLQAGVGAMAGGVQGYFKNHFAEHTPTTVIVEPQAADCIYRSAALGREISVEGMPETIMAGLNCGTPCKITWPLLRDYPKFYLSCDDVAAAYGMRIYANPVGEDETIISGESGAATMGAFACVMQLSELSEIKKRMGLDENSVILLFNTEGDTDPDSYENFVKKGAYLMPEKIL